MAVHQLVVTITATGVAQPLSTTNNPSINCREVQIQSPVGNASVKIGDVNCTATVYGHEILPSASQPDTLVMRDAGHNINLSSTYVVGTATQKVYVLYIQ